MKKKLTIFVLLLSTLFVCGGFTTYKAIEKHEVTYELDGGFITSDFVRSVRWVDDAELPTAEKEHYMFKGWTDGNDIMTTIKHARNNVFLTAVYSPEVYEVTFKDGNTVVSSTNYAYGTGVSDLSVFAKANVSKHPHEDFVCWKDAEGKEYKSLSETDFGDKVLAASYTGKTYKITYDLYDGTADGLPESYTYGSGIDSLPDASKDGKIFDGWYSDEEYTNQVTSIPSDSHGDIHLYAKYHDKPVTATVLNRRSYSSSGFSSTASSESVDYSTGVHIPKLDYHVSVSSGIQDYEAWGVATARNVAFSYWADADGNYINSTGEAGYEDTNSASNVIASAHNVAKKCPHWETASFFWIYDHASQGLRGLGRLLSAGDEVYCNGRRYTVAYSTTSVDPTHDPAIIQEEMSGNYSALVKTCTENNDSNYIVFLY